MAIKRECYSKNAESLFITHDTSTHEKLEVKFFGVLLLLCLKMSIPFKLIFILLLIYQNCVDYSLSDQNCKFNTNSIANYLKQF